ncbi:MAG: class II fumarate hydratase [Candidatus Dormibacteraeota bacterium]|uniref:Fumarate hydratase class II n=2 Tax=Candidatus Dormiibacter inghamiae TaxID=3127013 RepID=A0A934KBH9_9BACT|nr:class II fumarate hydratase [Candidatus Dormibacteraeota bacterium]MBJ7606445.1 class II fumarate hydratase [Candidatus Dormibacteraeota bacterium]
MGEMEVPGEALYGASTKRAVLNFPISGQRFPRRFIRALAQIKGAAAEVNAELGLLDLDVAAAIAAAAAEVAEGRWDDHFPIDVYQTGSGTSTNVNANEVIAHLATERLRDGRSVHPNDDVNLCQSSNDTIPTAMQLAGAVAIEERLLPGLERLETALRQKSEEFWPIVKTGRTHLQDATPIRLGQEFSGYAGQLQESMRRAGAGESELLNVPLGGTAVGTGINAHPEYARRACERLSAMTGLPVREAGNHFHAQATLDAVVSAHGALRSVALSLWKIGSDVRLMGMGPRAGLAELSLPETQPGSSIMPGKVNPVIIESLTMVVARVLGNDTTVAFAQTGSFLELNVMMPVAAVALLESIELLGSAAANFAERCVEGLRATERGPQLVEKGLMLATALAPLLGYDEAARLAKEALKSGRTIRELGRERGLTDEQLEELLTPERMTEPGLGAASGGG